MLTKWIIYSRIIHPRVEYIYSIHSTDLVRFRFHFLTAVYCVQINSTRKKITIIKPPTLRDLTFSLVLISMFHHTALADFVSSSLEKKKVAKSIIIIVIHFPTIIILLYMLVGESRICVIWSRLSLVRASSSRLQFHFRLQYTFMLNNFRTYICSRHIWLLLDGNYVICARLNRS